MRKGIDLGKKKKKKKKKIRICLTGQKVKSYVKLME